MEETGTSKRGIHRIERGVTERICTAQVVTDVQSAIRQLVDNAIDAKATTITITLRNHGIESFEVADDGSGIESENFDVLCKPHCTSKISNLSDFDALTTLGFRGEALNALCALSTVTIVTRAESAQAATKLTYDHGGSIVQRDTLARQKGTTVIVERLFETLPVRRREMERTAQKEFNRVLSLLQCFALFAPHIKFVCVHFLNGNRSQLMCTPGGANSRIDEVVSKLFGGRTDKNKMMKMEKSEPDEEVCALYSLDSIEKDIYDSIELRGWVSSCEHGFGRSSTDRQFVFFNNRPVDYPKICRTVNEIYQLYNRHQYPTLVLFIQVPPATIDVNVTPDKRTVIYQNEKKLLCIIRASILATYKPILGNCTTVEPKRKRTLFGEVEATSSSTSDCSNGNDARPQKSQSTDFNLSAVSDDGQVSVPASDLILPSISNMITDEKNKRKRSWEHVDLNLGTSAGKIPKLKSKNDSSVSDSNKPGGSFKFIPYIKSPQSSAPSSSPITKWLRSDMVNERVSLTETSNRTATLTMEETPEEQEELEFAANVKPTSIAEVEVTAAASTDSFEPDSEIIESPNMSTDQSTDFQMVTLKRTQQELPFSFSKLANRLKELQKKKQRPQIEKEVIAFETTVTANSEEAEKELDMLLSKVDLAEMSVVGQFNKGFIVTQLRGHLFIVDQHASDEKFNFEDFKRRATLRTQKLLLPQPLNMGSVQETLIKENVHIFNRNGFEFEFQESENGISAFLVSTPVLNNCQLDISDIDEILANVKDYPGQMYRPVKLRRIFASKACRKSVMVGDALNEKQMKTIISNLSILEHPWNCPHGRPTLRHLYDLTQ